jgi:hypothetical protein
MTQPTQIYYDLDVVNTVQPSQTNAQAAQPNRLTFTEIRSSPILDDPSEYFLSIVRFSLDTAGSMPLFIPQIELNNSAGGAPWNNTVYYISVEYNPPAAPQNRLIAKSRVIWVPQSNIYPTPGVVPATVQANTEPYYWCNNIQAFVCMMNNALVAAYADIIAQAAAAVPAITLPASWLVGNEPYFLWDAPSAKLTFVAPRLIFEQECLGNGTATGFVYLNNPLFTLFSSLETFHNYTYNPAPTSINDTEANYLLKVFNKRGGPQGNYVPANPAPVPPAPPPVLPYPLPFVGEGPPFDAYYMQQPYSTGATLCPIQSLVFTTTLVPVLPQLIGVPRSLSDNVGTGGASGQNDNISNEITDLVVNLVNGTEYFPNVLYLPTAEYRLIDLQSNAPLYGIQINVLWKDVYGIQHDFYLQNGCSCSLKVMFRKKNAPI